MKTTSDKLTAGEVVCLALIGIGAAGVFFSIVWLFAWAIELLP